MVGTGSTAARTERKASTHQGEAQLVSGCIGWWAHAAQGRAQIVRLPRMVKRSWAPDTLHKVLMHAYRLVLWFLCF
jgi:hypothetical protein